MANITVGSGAVPVPASKPGKRPDQDADIKKKTRGFERDMLGEASRHRTVLWMLAFVMALFAVWAANAPLEEVTRGSGKVIPLSRGQLIQSLEGGIVASINVQEGQEVAAGQVLAVMDDTRFRSEYSDLESQSLALRASIARLKAEAEDRPEVAFSADVEAHRDMVAAERALFEARRRNQAETVSSLNERIEIMQQRSLLAQAMIKKKAMSVVEGLDVDQELADLRGRLQDATNAYYQDINDKLTQQRAELESLAQKLMQKEDALSRTDLRAPVRGIVKNLNVTTKGAVVGPGDPIMEIVPLDDKLYVEAEVRPRDVAFLHVGQPANVKITAYDYTVYGSLNGELVFISADTMIDENRREPEPFYRVRVLTDTAHLTGPEGELPIKPGMIAEVDILTGSKTVMDYLMKPILRGKDALTER